MSELTIALAKGRLADLSIELLEACGVDCTAVRNPGRRLVMIDQANQTRFVLVKPSDVPVYVERGVADIGIVGKDTLMEAGSPVYEMLDLGFARCRLCIAGFPTQQAREPVGANWRVATKYPNIARSYFGAKGLAHRHHPLKRVGGARAAGGLIRRDTGHCGKRQHIARQRPGCAGRNMPHQRPPDSQPRQS